MNKKILTSSLLSILCFALLIVTSAMEASGQGRYANKYSKRDVSGIITKLEQSSNTFRRDFDRNLDQSSLNGTREEDRLNDIVRNYESSLNGLRNDFNSSDSWWQSRSNVESVMDDARQVNVMMNSLPFARKLESQWNRMRRDINKLADTFDLPDLASSGGNGNWNSGGGYVPNWSVGTFYGRNPRTGGTITLTVESNGIVSADFGGSSTRGTLNGQNLNMNGAYARVTQINNGIRTRSTENGETIDYYRNSGSGLGNIGGNVPEWAIGTFSGRNPRTGERMLMTIRPNGEVSVNLRDSTVYGTIYNTTLTINGATAVVKRKGQGIRTESTNNNERIDYNRESDGDSGDGGWNSSVVPSWAVGTFYGRNPQTGGTITLIVGSNGNVSADFGGTVSNGSINGQNLNMGGATARVTRISNGIRTTSTSDGQVIEYFRNGSTGDTVGVGNVPDWAVGTFYGRNPNDGRTIVLTINRNGNVTIDFGSGSLTSGSIDNNYLRVGNATSRVTRIRDGIRTTGTADGQIIEYFINNPR
jgi:hypothetical protein